MRAYFDKCLLILQLILFAGGRMADNLNWYPQLGQEVQLLQKLSIAGLVGAPSIKILRHRNLPGLLLKLFWLQVSFYLPYCIAGIDAYFYSQSDVIGLSTETKLQMAIIILTTFNYSLVSDQQFITRPEFFVYTIFLLGEIIFESLMFIKYSEVFRKMPLCYLSQLSLPFMDILAKAYDKSQEEVIIKEQSREIELARLQETNRDELIY